jgi:hypothetical protein
MYKVLSIRRHFVACWLVICAPLTRSAVADDDLLMDALTTWRSGLQQVSTIVSDFVQEKHMALFLNPLTIRGRLFITMDGRFAWETHEPVRYKLVVADGRIRQWDEETGRVQTISLRDNPVAEAIQAQMSVWFSGQYDQLADTYSVTLKSTDPVVFQFIPLDNAPAADYLKSVQVRLRSDGQYLDTVLITEPTGDSTSILFTNTVLNQTLPDAVWEVQRMAPDMPLQENPAPDGDQ